MANGEKKQEIFCFFKGEWRKKNDRKLETLWSFLRANGEKEKGLVHERQKLKEINETNSSETFTLRQILFEEKNA